MHEPAITPAGGHAATATIRLTGADLGVPELAPLLRLPPRIEIDDAVWRRVAEGEMRVKSILDASQPVYGVNTGFGNLCTKQISPDKLSQLQENLLVSHAVGVGPPAPREIVRLMLLLKIHALGRGYSGVRRATVEMLAALLNADALPVVPTQGSLGASGDLAPLAHMVLPLIGRGQLQTSKGLRDAGDVLASLRLSPLTLAPKEGLALINGTQLMTAYAVALVCRARHLVKHADIIASIALEGLRGSLAPFARDLNALRPHRGALEAADNVCRLMEGSKILVSHANCGKVQDPYSLRCVPQVHGATRQALHHAAEVVTTEVNAVTDNPVLLADRTISGGLFHGQPLAIMLDYLAIAIAELASISERRIYLLLSGHDELPTLLMKETGLNSGFMLPQYTAAALVSENKVFASPASVDSIPTSLGQEDHVSMGATAATKAWRILDNVETVLAIEGMCAAQALDYRAPIEPGRGVKIAHQVIRSRIEHAESDRLFGDDIQVALKQLRDHEVVDAVEAKLGELQ